MIFDPSKHILGCDIKTDGFSLETGHLIISLLDVSSTYIEIIQFKLPFKWTFTSFWVSLNTLQKDESGKLGLMEFHLLWSKIQKYLVSCKSRLWTQILISLAVDVNMQTRVMQEIFKNHDTDNSGTMSSHEMRGAANEAGKKGELDTQIQLSSFTVLNELCHYSPFTHVKHEL